MLFAHDVTPIWGLARLHQSSNKGGKARQTNFNTRFARGEREHLLYFASFSKSFAVAGLTTADVSIWLEANADRFPIFKLGDFGR
jgi:hypothetical protein